MLLSLKSIIGHKVVAIDGEIGTVSDLLFSEKSGALRYVVIDPQKWNPLSQRVLISPVSIYYINVDSKQMYLSITQEKVQSSPGVEEQETVSRHFEAKLYQHYGYGYYWMGTDLWGISSDPMMLKGQSNDDSTVSDSESESDIDLRSISEVTRYSCIAADDSSHAFADIIVDTRKWSMPYFVVDIGANLLQDNLAVVNWQAIGEISWKEQSVKIKVNKHQLAANPHFDSYAINSDAFLEMMSASPTDIN